MNTKNFKCFQIVYEEKNLSAAAKKLFLTPQGLGKIIIAHLLVIRIIRIV